MNTSSEESQAARPKKRRFQYSLASLFLLTAICALLFRFPALLSFFAAWATLFITVMAALLAFIILVYLPVRILFERLGRSNEASEPEVKQEGDADN